MGRLLWVLGVSGVIGISLCFFSGCGSSQTAMGQDGSIIADNIISSRGGIIAVTDKTSLIKGVTISIPTGALSKETAITIKQVDSPPALPMGFNFVGTPIDFGPDGTVFSIAATVEIPFTGADLDRAGVSDVSTLQLYVFDKATHIWSQGELVAIDTVTGKATVKAYHFSFYALAGFSGYRPSDLGKPLPGDLLYKLSISSESKSYGWVPGHVGMYTGEKEWNGNGLASDEVKRCRKYNVVEALWTGVQYSYYKIPGATQSCQTEALFEGDSVYMGARQPRSFSLSSEQRSQVVAFVEEQVGKPYTKWQSYGALFDMLTGQFVKGPNSFNCVGLVEKAYEVANTNVIDDYAHGIVPYDEADTLTPAMQYKRTKSAIGQTSSGGGWGEVIPW